MAHGKFPESERTQADANQLLDRQAHGVAHASDLVALALGDGQLQPALLPARSQDPDVGWSGAAFLEMDTLREPLDRVRAGLASDLGLIGFPDGVEPRREGAG